MSLKYHGKIKINSCLYRLRVKKYNTEVRKKITIAKLSSPESNFPYQQKFQVPSACLVHDEAL